jgi:hypothetical protein
MKCSIESRSWWKSGWWHGASELRRVSVRQSPVIFSGLFLKAVYQLVLVPPSPPAYWNHGVRRRFSLRSLILNDLQIKSLRTKDLAAFWCFRLSKECPKVGLGRLLWPRHRSGCADQAVIVAHRGLGVCDGAYRCFVMKTVREVKLRRSAKNPERWRDMESHLSKSEGRRVPFSTHLSRQASLGSAAKSNRLITQNAMSRAPGTLVVDSETGGRA